MEGFGARWSVDSSLGAPRRVNRAGVAVGGSFLPIGGTPSDISTDGPSVRESSIATARRVQIGV
jgi:hypothetical protein